MVDSFYKNAAGKIKKFLGNYDRVLEEFQPNSVTTSNPMCKKPPRERHRRGVGGTTGFLFSDWLKITFIFRIRSVAGL